MRSGGSGDEATGSAAPRSSAARRAWDRVGGRALPPIPAGPTGDGSEGNDPFPGFGFAPGAGRTASRLVRVVPAPARSLDGEESPPSPDGPVPVARRRAAPWRAGGTEANGGSPRGGEPSGVRVRDVPVRTLAEADALDAPVPRAAPVVESWRDPDRRGWLILAAMTGIAIAFVLGDAVARPRATPALLMPPGVSAISPLTVDVATRPVPTPIGDDAAAEAQAEPAPSGVAAGPGRAALTGAYGLAWLLGAWVVDREARRALVARGPWGERRTLAYLVVAVVVVLPLMLGGILLGAWGAVGVVLAFGRTDGPEAGWRAAGVLGAAILAVVIARHPVGGAARWVFAEASRVASAILSPRTARGHWSRGAEKRAAIRATAARRARRAVIDAVIGRQS